MFMPLHFPVSISPRVIAELRSVLQHPLSYGSSETVERCIVFQRAPGDRIMAMRQP